MNKPMYLVVIRCTMDDVPVILTDNEFFANALTDAMTDAEVEHHIKRYGEYAGIDVTQPVCIAMTTFGELGIMTAVRVGRDLT